MIVFLSNWSHFPGSEYDDGISPISSFEGEFAPAPSLDGELPQEPSLSPEEKEFYYQLRNENNREVCDAIFSNIFLNESNPVIDNCCSKLLLVGRQCHDGS
ncbi:hypothetical protein SLE2022_271340 [Rubroshorea leprosula]